MKIERKRQLKIFWRTVRISSIVVFCLIFGFIGAAKAYENTVRIGFGIYRPAVEWNEDGLRIFDFTFFTEKSSDAS